MQKQTLIAKGRRTFINILYAALISALAIGSVGQISAVQAAPAREPITWYMDVIHPKTKICVGETVEYSVKVYYVNHTAETPSEWALSGKKIEATSSDKNVGNFKKDTAITGFGNEDMVTASFSFNAKKAGKTNLYFEGLLFQKFTSSYVSFTVPVTVIPCKFKVVTTSQMSKCYPGGCIKFLGVIVQGQVKADENGYFTGTAPVVWLSTSAVPNCGAVNSLGISKVNMRGNLNESGQLLLELNYDKVKFLDVVTCPMGSGSSNTAIKVSPLKVTVSTASGVVVKLNQQLDGGPGGVAGSALVYVIPLDGAK